MALDPIEEQLIGDVLTSLLGKDPHNPNVHIVLQSDLAMKGIEAIIYGLVRGDQMIIDVGQERLRTAIENILEVRAFKSA
jgi:hypothetical protein